MTTIPLVTRLTFSPQLWRDLSRTLQTLLVSFFCSSFRRFLASFSFSSMSDWSKLSDLVINVFSSILSILGSSAFEANARLSWLL
ncbi:hypothetical protein CY34DRAFT_740736 [Suillus luteus UH-Slu-Lm8-n1]|uniref:Uncharacterized protein n=1 Tax=Suillus luteus UH-Slu-Lm8-n1 TaxID=930992 RepID=A0A0C9ZUJ4_9AGAM|nr:hypothetical protein CY34DRAFT_740736 [Suillus luteus UH-Slu-Lm8-n1]